MAPCDNNNHDKGNKDISDLCHDKNKVHPTTWPKWKLIIAQVQKRSPLGEGGCSLICANTIAFNVITLLSLYNMVIFFICGNMCTMWVALLAPSYVDYAHDKRWHALPISSLGCKQVGKIILKTRYFVVEAHMHVHPCRTNNVQIEYFSFCRVAYHKWGMILARFSALGVATP